MAEKKHIKVAFVLPNLLTGGTQRAIVNVAQSLNLIEFNSLLILIHKAQKNYSKKRTGNSYISNFDENRIRLVSLGCENVRWSILKLRKYLLQERPDIVITSITYFNMYVALFSFLLPGGTKFVARETNLISIKYSGHWMSPIQRLFFRLGYKFMHYIICQSEDMRDDLITNFGVSPDKIEVINNPVDTNWLNEKASETSTIKFNPEYYNIVSVGHLTAQKNYETAIRAMSKIGGKKIRLYIIGRGPLEGDLKFLVNKLGLEGLVFFLGFQDNPFPIVKKADLFLMTSLYEGFPNALVEAIALGTPVVSSNCKGGISEIVTKQNGKVFSVGDSDSLADNLMDLMDKTFDRNQIGKETQSKFSLNSLAKQYESFFTRLTKSN